MRTLTKTQFAFSVAGMLIAAQLLDFLIFGHWIQLLIVNSILSAFFAIIYTVIYVAETEFWRTPTGIHLATSMVSIVLVLTAWALVLLFDRVEDTLWTRILSLTFILLPFTQLWRVILLVVAGIKQRRAQND